ncbi:MAG: ubiquinol-cytochrome c reductase iron-sulfur subunit [Micropepsaceae bacterium]
MNDEPVRRRSFLVTAAFATAGVGAVAALWPIIDSMNPAADTRARATVFKLSALDIEKPSTIALGKFPVMIFRRSAQMLADLRATLQPAHPRAALFRDLSSTQSKQPDNAKNWHRSLKPEIMVCIANCTREGCLVSRTAWASEPADVLRCLCCGATFDLAGHIFSGPARHNLTVPNHRFIGDQEIEFNEIVA